MNKSIRVCISLMNIKGFVCFLQPVATQDIIDNLLTLHFTRLLNICNTHRFKSQYTLVSLRL